MPALLAPLVGFALGALLALHARRDAERYDEQAMRAAYRVALIFAVVVFAPVATYFTVFPGDWSVAYLAEARAIPSALALLWVVASTGAVSLGFAAALHAARRRARRVLVACVAGPIAVVFIVVAALFPELSVEGTTVGVRGHFGTRPLAGSALGWAVLVMDALLVAGLAVAQRALVPPREVAPSRAPIHETPSAEPSEKAAAAAPPTERPRLLGKQAARRPS